MALSRRQTLLSEISHDPSVATHVTFPNSVSRQVSEEPFRSPSQLAVKKSRAVAARASLRRSDRYSLHDQLFLPRGDHRRSILSNAAGGSQRGSAVAAPKLAPTYQLRPKKTFCRNLVTPIIEETLATELTGAVYDANAAGTRSCLMAETIKERVKALDFDRYKFVVEVSVGSKNDGSSPPGTIVASQGLWDSSTDGFASATFVNDSVFAVATVYGVYAE